MKNILYSVFIGLILMSCESNQLEPLVDCSLNPPAISLVSKSDANCGQTNGSIEVTASGGSGEYQFFTDNVAKQVSGTFEGLSAGLHTIFVEDVQGCTDTLEVTIENVDGVSIASTSVENAGCGGGNGSVTIAATSGVGPYTYQLDNGSFQTDNIFSNLVPGSYKITVKDSQDCEFSQDIQVNSGISYAQSVAPIIANNCSVSGCHNGSQFPNFTNFQNVQANAANIMSRTQSRSMPLGRTLTQQEIDIIACWVEDGALDN